MEATGVALAILPLLLNQLDDYVQGLQTLKSFRSKRYRRTLYEYFSNIGTQHTLFLNTLERILDGVVEYEDDIDELINNPSGGCWQRVELQKKLENKLGRSYAPFMAEMNQLSGLLQDLKAKLSFEDRYSEQVILRFSMVS